MSTGAPGWAVSLWASAPTGWRLLTWVRSGTGGSYSISYAPPTPGVLTVKTAIGVTLAAALAISSPRSLTVLDRTNTLAHPAPAYTALTNVTLVGRVLPAQVGGRVVADVLYLGCVVGFAIVTPDAAGVYRIPIPDDHAYHWIVRTRTIEAPATAIEYAPPVTFDVRTLLNPASYPVAVADVPTTYRSGCPVGPSSLRRLVLTYWGFDNRLHRGELIARDAAVGRMIVVWNAALLYRFPIRQMRRVDVFGGSDLVSMAADNTSMFNCRTVTGNPYALSPHAYEYAIDVNTVENPYQDVYGRWYPSNGLGYLDRSNVRIGMLLDASTPTRALRGQGYFWGKGWSHPDYQHFQPG